LAATGIDPVLAPLTDSWTLSDPRLEDTTTSNFYLPHHSPYALNHHSPQYLGAASGSSLREPPLQFLFYFSVVFPPCFHRYSVLRILSLVHSQIQFDSTTYKSLTTLIEGGLSTIARRWPTLYSNSLIGFTWERH